MKRPSSLRINGRDVPVRYVSQKKLPDALGEFHYDGHILIRTKLTHGETVDTVLHEAMHAILHYAGVEPCPAEEKYVRALASGLVGVLNDNPDFAQWLISNPPTPSKT